MDPTSTSPFVSPGFVLAALGQLCLLIFFIAKNYFRTEHSHERIDDIETTRDRDRIADKLKVKEIELAISESKNVLVGHISDIKAHNNAEAVLEFRKNLDRQLEDFKHGLEDIARKLNHISGRE